MQMESTSINRCQLSLTRYFAKGFEFGDSQLNGQRFRASQGIEISTPLFTDPERHRGGRALRVFARLIGGADPLGFEGESTAKTTNLP